ncbi:solute carrier family 25 member 35-like [Euwallacea similis]|uniref:solute carrier family 25 member 35-like n=1 Tax=Euwallacea similis TaxID=1736056 RepID=UPI00344FDB34
MEFALGGVAAMGACLFTNPLEVLKTRLQLQGELQAKGAHVVHYKNVLHAGYVVAKNDGFLALQKGLVPALWVQLIMNGSRLGVYGYADTSGFLRDNEGNLLFTKSILITGLGSVIGQYSASPLFLVKTHLQAQAVQAIAVGYQHQHTGTFQALTNIFNANGIKGLFRGAVATIPRAFIGGSSQIMCFEYTKQWIDRYNITDNSLLRSFMSSMVGGIVVSVVMTPFDLIMTRLYNQPTDASGKGLLYNNYFDCTRKIYQSEGITAFFKGIGPMYLRLGPHTVLCLVFFDVLRGFAYSYFPPKTSTKVQAV